MQLPRLIEILSFRQNNPLSKMTSRIWSPVLLPAIAILVLLGYLTSPASFAQQPSAESQAAGEIEPAEANPEGNSADASSPAPVANVKPGDPPPDLADILSHKLAGRPAAEPDLGQQYAIALDYLLPRIDGSGSREQDDAIELLRAIALHATRPENEIGRAACAAAICSTLSLNLPTPATTQLLRVLALAGDDQAVPAIANFLTHPSPLLQEEARSALTTIGTDASADAISSAISETIPARLTAGLIHSLGQIGRSQDAAHILPFLASEDSLLRETAIRALVVIGGTPAIEALSPLLYLSDDEEQKADPQIATQLLQLADLTKQKNEVAAASTLYASLQVAGIPAAIRSAALVGQVTCQPEDALDVLRGHLTGEDPVMQEAAIRAAAELDSGTGIITLLREFATATANPVATSAILRQLELRQAPEALLEIRKMATEGGPEIAPEAIGILGRIGAPSDLNLLLSLAATGTEATTSAARNAIGRFKGDDKIEATLKGHIDNESGNTSLRAEAIRAAGNRSHRALLLPILPLLSSADPTISAASFESISRLAVPEDIPDLASRLQDPQSPAFPKLRAILLKLCQRTENPEEAAGSIIAATAEAGSETKAVSLGLLAVLGIDSTLAHVTNLLDSEIPELRAAAIRSLSDWSSFAPANKLLEMLRAAEYSEPEKSQILSGIARLARTPDIAPFDNRLRLALDALPSASSTGDARKLISSLATLPSMETADVLEELFQREDIAKEAAAAAIQVAGNLPDDPAGKARRAVLLQKALALPGLPDSLRAKAQTLAETP